MMNLDTPVIALITYESTSFDGKWTSKARSFVDYGTAIDFLRVLRECNKLFRNISFLDLR